jgi:hypothetical protein
MADTVGDFVLMRLAQWGVQRIFGYPGDGINGVITAFERDLRDPAQRFSGASSRPDRHRRACWDR